MKLLRKWKDTKYGVENFLYEDKNGLQVLHTLNKQSLDTYASISVNAGSYFEKDINVPSGTAHFLEHVLFSPNYEFKTRKDLDEFDFGNKERSALLLNGMTGFKKMSLYGFTHASRENDLMKRLSQVVAFPLELVAKNMPREKKIILAELQHELKPEKDSILQLVNFALDNKVHNNDFRIIGVNAKAIKSIKPEHLISFYKSQFNIKNSILSIQSPTELTSTVLEYIESISETLSANGDSGAKIYEENLSDEKKVGFFHNTEQEGINIILYRYQDNKGRKKDYKNDNLSDLRTALIQYITFNELREKKGYLYHIGRFRVSSCTWDYSLNGFQMTTKPNNFKKAIEGLNQIINEESLKFLKTDTGEKWFQNNISRFLFPRTVSYQDEYAHNISNVIHEGYEVFDFDKAKQAAEKITINDLVEYIEKENNKYKYSYWIDSPKKIGVMKKQIKEINLFNDYLI